MTSSRRRGPTARTWSSATRTSSRKCWANSSGPASITSANRRRISTAGQRADSTDWPARSSYFGFVDLAGFPKDRYYLYQSQWTKTPMVHLLPHWNWKGMEGQPIPVMAYTNADEVELFLNGKSLGRKKRFAETWEMPVGANVSPEKTFASKYRRVWEVPYAPGTLKAVAYNNGKQVAVDEVHTAGEPARIVLSPDRSTITADGDDLSFVTVRIEDKDGNLCPLADNLVKFNVTGAGKIASRGQRQRRHRRAVPRRPPQGVQRAGAGDCARRRRSGQDPRGGHQRGAGAGEGGIDDEEVELAFSY